MQDNRTYEEGTYWKPDRCTGFNCCHEKDCPHAPKYQPWLFDERRKEPTMQDRIDAIRARCDAAKGCVDNCVTYATFGSAHVINASLDDIPRLLERLAALQADYDRLNDFEQSQCAKLLEKLGGVEAELAASQARGMVAVSDLELAAREMQEGIGVCVACKHYPADMSNGMPEVCDECTGGDKCFFEWRGPLPTAPEKAL